MNIKQGFLFLLLIPPPIFAMGRAVPVDLFFSTITPDTKKEKYMNNLRTALDSVVLVEIIDKHKMIVTGTCSGNLVSKQTVLTAAHCVSRNMENSFIRVTFGDRPFLLSGRDLLSYRVTKRVIHPKYKSTLLDGKESVDRDVFQEVSQYDLALLYISEAPPVVPVAISLGIGSMKYRHITSAGFGEVANLNINYSIKEAGQVGRGVGIKRLDRFYIANTSEELKVQMFTAYSSTPGSSTVCSGDSGGPAFVENKESFSIIGIASGYNPAVEDNPTIDICLGSDYTMYVFVPGHRQWIGSTIRTLESNSKK